MGLLTWVRRKDTPLQRAVYVSLKRAERARFPVVPGLHRAFLLERSFRKSIVRQLISKIYHEPLLRLSCTRVGERLQLFEDMPKILGNLRIEVGSDVGIEGANVWIGAGDANAKALNIGDNSYLGYSMIIVVGTEVSIGRHVLIANHVLLNGYDGHPLDPLARARGEPAGPAGQGSIRISDYAWIGNRAIVLKNVSIGRGAVIASGAVVTRDVEDLTVVAGNPARVVRHIEPPKGWGPADSIGAPPRDPRTL
jgi:acetyltransferase-like isoleucine patch superfamily enzyme